MKKFFKTKMAIYGSRFLKVTGEICRNHMNREAKYLCSGCPYEVKDFGDTHLTGCILSTPDGWDRPDQLRYIIRTTLRYMRKGGADHVKKKAAGKNTAKAGCRDTGSRK